MKDRIQSFRFVCLVLLTGWAVWVPGIAFGQEAPSEVPAPRVTAAQKQKSTSTHSFSIQSPPRIAVLPFHDTNEDATGEGYGKTVSAMITTALMDDPNVQVVERKELSRILKEQGFSLAGATATAIVPGQIRSIDAFMFGDVSLLREGDSLNPEQALEVDVRMINVATAQVIASKHFQCARLIADLRHRVAQEARGIIKDYLRPFSGKMIFEFKFDDKMDLGETEIYWRRSGVTIDGKMMPTGEMDNTRIHLGALTEIEEKTKVQKAPPMPATTAAEGDSSSEAMADTVARRKIYYKTYETTQDFLRGAYVLTFRRKGYENVRVTQNVYSGMRSPVRVEFRPAFSVLKIRGELANKSISVRGLERWNSRISFMIDVDSTGQLASIDWQGESRARWDGVSLNIERDIMSIRKLRVGRYDLRISEQEAYSMGVVSFHSGSVQENILLSATGFRYSIPSEKKTNSGKVTVFLKPFGPGPKEKPCRIFVDGNLIGSAGLIGEINISGIPAGSHYLHISPHYASHLQYYYKRFVVEPNRTTKLFAELRPKPEKRSLIRRIAAAAQLKRKVKIEKPDAHPVLKEAGGKNPGAAFLLSFLIPGAGQFYVGSPGAGVTYLVVETCNWVMWPFIFPLTDRNYEASSYGLDQNLRSRYDGYVRREWSSSQGDYWYEYYDEDKDYNFILGIILSSVTHLVSGIDAATKAQNPRKTSVSLQHDPRQKETSLTLSRRF